MSPAPPDHEEPAMKRLTWQTEERIVASAVGAPGSRDAGRSAGLGFLQADPKASFAPAAFGPGLVCEYTAILRTARHGMPLRSPGAGFG